MTNKEEKQIHHTANSLNAMIDEICKGNGWTQDETLRPKSKISVTVKVAMPKPASSISNSTTEQAKPNMTLDEYKKQIGEYLREHMNFTEEDIEDSLQECNEMITRLFKKNWKVSVVATMIYNEL